MIVGPTGLGAHSDITRFMHESGFGLCTCITWLLVSWLVEIVTVMNRTFLHVVDSARNWDLLQERYLFFFTFEVEQLGMQLGRAPLGIAGSACKIIIIMLRQQNGWFVLTAPWVLLQDDWGISESLRRIFQRTYDDFLLINFLSFSPYSSSLDKYFYWLSCKMVVVNPIHTHM